MIELKELLLKWKEASDRDDQEDTNRAQDAFLRAYWEHQKSNPLSRAEIDWAEIAEIMDKALDALDVKDISTAENLLSGLPSEPNPLIVTSTWDDAHKPPDREWIVGGWLPRGRFGLFTGRGGVGKSRLMLQLAVAVASKGEEEIIKDWLPHTSPTAAPT